MNTEMKLRNTYTMLEREAGPWLKLKEQDDECNDRQSVVGYFPHGEYLPSDFGFRVVQRDAREIPWKKNQECGAENTSITNNEFRLNPCSKEFIPLSKQRHLIYQSQSAQPLVLNPSAAEFIPQSRNLSSHSSNIDDKKINLQQTSAAPYADYTALTSKQDNIKTAGYSQQESQSTETQKLNPCAEIFMPQLKNTATVSLHTYDKNHILEKMHAVSDLHKTPVTEEQTKPLCIRLNYVTPRSEDTIANSLDGHVTTDAEGDVELICLSQQVPLIDESQPILSGNLNPNAAEFAPLSRYQTTLTNTEDNNHIMEETGGALCLVNIPINLNMTESLGTDVHHVTSQSADIVGKVLDECIYTTVEDGSQTVCLSQKEQSVYQSQQTELSQKENTVYLSKQTVLSQKEQFVCHRKNNVSITERTVCLSQKELFVCRRENSLSVTGRTVCLSQKEQFVCHRMNNVSVTERTLCLSQKEHGVYLSKQPELSQKEHGVYRSQEAEFSQKEQGMYQSQPTEFSQKEQGVNLSKQTELSQTEHGVYQSQSTELSQKVQDVCQLQEPKLSQKDQGVFRSQLTEPRALNPCANAFIPNLRNRPTISHETDEPSQNVQQKRSTLDLESTPLTSKPRGSLSSCRGNAKLRSGKTFLMRLNECIADAAEADIKTARQTQQESRPIESQKLNPCAEIFVPTLKHLSPASLTTDNEGHKEIPEASDLYDTAVTAEQICSFNIRLNSVTPKPENTIANWLDECVTTDVEDDPETSCLSQQMDLIHLSRPIMSGNLNPCANDFIPQSRNLSSLSPSTEDKNHTDSNPRAKSFIPQSGNMSSDSNTTESHILMNSGALSAISCDNSKNEIIYLSPSYELSLGQLQPSVSTDDNVQRENIMTLDAAMSSSVHVGDDTSTLHSITSPTVAGINNQLPVNSDLPNNDFRRTPRRIYQGCLQFDAVHEDVRETENQYKGLQILNKLQFPQNDDFLDIPDQQFNARLDQESPVTDESECGVGNLVARLESAEMEAERWKLLVSSLTMDHAMEKTRYQLYIKDLHKQMEADDRKSINMQMHMLDLQKQVTIDRIEKKLEQTDNHFSELFEALRNNAMTESEVQSKYKVLYSYMTDCKALKLEVETLARDLQEKLEFGVDVDMSGMDKHPPSFPELPISLSPAVNERRTRTVLR